MGGLTTHMSEYSGFKLKKPPRSDSAYSSSIVSHSCIRFIASCCSFNESHLTDRRNLISTFLFFF